MLRFQQQLVPVRSRTKQDRACALNRASDNVDEALVHLSFFVRASPGIVSRRHAHLRQNAVTPGNDGYTHASTAVLRGHMHLALDCSAMRKGAKLLHSKPSLLHHEPPSALVDHDDDGVPFPPVLSAPSPAGGEARASARAAERKAGAGIGTGRGENNPVVNRPPVSSGTIPPPVDGDLPNRANPRKCTAYNTNKCYRR